MRIICIYGKGGIGKSTLACNLSVCLAMKNLKVLQIGCDPKSDSTFNILGGWVKPILSKLDEYKFDISQLSLDDKIVEEKYGVHCMEVGGPPSGRGCAGRGIIRAIDSVNDIIDEINPDVLVLDVLGDIICGGLIMPMWKLSVGKKSDSNEIYIVADGDFMTIYAANRLVEAIHWLNSEYQNKTRLGGIICNAVKGNPDFLVSFSQQVGTDVVGFIPHSNAFIECGMRGIPVVEIYPNSNISHIFHKMAHDIWFRSMSDAPKALSEEGLNDIRYQIMEEMIQPKREAIL